MSFTRENEMYDFIAEWLKTRDVYPCESTVVDTKEDNWTYSFSFGGKSHRVDVIGVYTVHGSVRFVGVEAKLKPRKILTASRQALPLSNFCHEVYVAVPEESYKKLYPMDQSELRAYLSKIHTGLLLVRNTGRVKVSSIIPIEPIPFSLNIHRDAEEHFRWNYDNEKLLAVFRTRRGKQGLRWLKEEWRVDEEYTWTNDDEYGGWIHEGRGHVRFHLEKIVVDVNVDVNRLLRGVATTYDSLKKQLRTLNANIQFLMELELLTLPRLVMEMDTASVELDSIDEDTLPVICSLVRNLGIPGVILRAELPRPLILEPGGEEPDFIDIIRQVYDPLLKIAIGLESLQEV